MLPKQKVHSLSGSQVHLLPPSEVVRDAHPSPGSDAVRIQLRVGLSDSMGIPLLLF